MFGESKMGILKKIPEQWIPKTVFAPKEQIQNDFESVKKLIIEKGIVYPLIAKPNVGERGFLVKKITTEQELKLHLQSHPTVDFIIQDFVDYSMELAVMYYRFPNDKQGTVSSICLKSPLTVTGNGRETLGELVVNYPRARFQAERLEKEFAHLWNEVLPTGQELLLEPIGNHCRGTTFLNGNDFIDAELTQAFDKIMYELEGIYFGRFDLKCESIEDLKQLKNVAILELNGVAAEPAHIYDPSFRLMKAWGVLAFHWKIIFKISRDLRKTGVRPMGFSEFWGRWKDYKRYMEEADK